MNYCAHYGVNYSYTNEGLFVEINGNIKYLKLNMEIPADFVAFTLKGPNIVDIGNSVYILMQDRVYKYDMKQIRYLDGKFIVETADGLFSIDSDGLRKILTASEKAQWEDAVKIKELSALNIFGESDYEENKKNRSAVYRDGRKRFIMELKWPN